MASRATRGRARQHGEAPAAPPRSGGLDRAGKLEIYY